METRYQTKLITSDDELRALATEWRALHTAADRRNPFLSHEWTLACRAHHCPDAELWVVAARKGDRLVGIAPLRREREAGFKVLRFIGDGRSDYLGFLLGPEPAAAQDALLQGLQQRRSEWDLAILRQLAQPYSQLAAAAPPDSLRAYDTEGTVAPHLIFPGNWDALLAAGPGWLKRMQKASRKWIKDGGTVLRIEDAEAARYVDQITEIEAASWKGEEGVARFQPGRGQRLLREALEELCPRGEMELWMAWKDDRPAAFEINFLAPGRIWLYQGAYRTDYRKYSPGGVLDFLSIERAWNEGAREYDFMSGDEPYKAERTSAQRSIRYLALHPETVRGHLAYGLLVAPRWGLKSYAPARAAHQWWVRRARRGPRPTRPEPAAQALSGGTTR
jgi:CelD/BcsL family acetyltransferase involved in cellulose biosynthesis